MGELILPKVGFGGDAPLVLSCLWIFTGITLLFVCLRLWARIKVVQVYGWDDWFYVMAFIHLVVYDVLVTYAAQYGFGQTYMAIADFEQITRAILLTTVAQTILVLGTVWSKMSMAMFLLRLVTNRRDKLLILVPLVFLMTAVVATIFVFWLSCEPYAYLWDRRLPNGSCPINPAPVAMYAGTWSVLLDFWYSAFPWFLLWKVQMPKREKYIIAGSMSLGVLAAAAGIKRAMELRHLGNHENYLQNIVGIIIWHAAELAATMICIGIPATRPLYKDWLRRNMTTRRGITNASGRGGNGWNRGGAKSGHYKNYPLYTVNGSPYDGAMRQKNGATVKHDSDASSIDMDFYCPNAVGGNYTTKEGATVSHGNTATVTAGEDIGVGHGGGRPMGMDAGGQYAGATAARTMSDNDSQESILGNNYHRGHHTRNSPSNNDNGFGHNNNSYSVPSGNILNKLRATPAKPEEVRYPPIKIKTEVHVRT